MKCLRKQKMKATAALLFIMVAASGCGDAGRQEQAVETGFPEDKNETENKTEKKQDITDPVDETPKFQYIELTEIEDYYGDKSMYECYAPKGNSIENGYLSYFDHGLTFTASVFGSDLSDYLVETLESTVEFKTDELTAENSEVTEFEVSDVLKNGEDVYQIITAKKEDLFGSPYEVNYIYYMDVQENGGGVFWDLELYEIQTDEETDLIIDELAAYYDADFDAVKAGGEWAAADEEYFNQMKEEEKKEEDSLPETVLWFNATYAPLTYSNDGNWKVVGGMQPSESGKWMVQYALERDWGIEDADSAIETIENLKKNGHRARCRECMEELEKLEILGERDEEKLLRALSDAGIEENLYRYVLANQMYRSGLDADYIAAWDLCRVNQLYADFYICGYMTYEEAMDASLENSVILQQMYSSWDDMAVAYLIGYQFWQSDPMLTEDSPTAKRYRNYLDLLEAEDGPYTLDWNMKLQKSW